MKGKEETDEYAGRRYPENIWVMTAGMMREIEGETLDPDPMIAWTSTAAAYLNHVRSQGRLPAPTLAVAVHRMFVAAPVSLRVAEAPPDEETGPPGASPMEMTILAAVPGTELWEVQRDVDLLLRKRDTQRTDQARRSPWRGIVTIRDIAEALAMVDAGCGGAAGITFHHGRELEDLYGRPRMAELRRRIMKKKKQVEEEERYRRELALRRRAPSEGEQKE